MAAETMMLLAYLQTIASAIGIGYALAGKDPRIVLLPVATLAIAIGQLAILLKPLLVP